MWFVLILAAVVPLPFWILSILAPWIRQRQHLIDYAAKLPTVGDVGPLSISFSSSWRGILDVWHSLPLVPGRRPVLHDIIPWWTEQCRRIHIRSSSNNNNDDDDDDDEENDDGLFCMWMFHPRIFPFAKCIVTIVDPELIFEVLGPKGYSLYRKGYMIDTARPLLGSHSILTLPDGPEWKTHRRMVSPALIGQKILEQVTKVSAQLFHDELFVLLKTQEDHDDCDDATANNNNNNNNNNNGVDVGQYLMRFTLDVIGQVAFSYSFRSLRGLRTPTKHCGSFLYRCFNTITETLALRTQSTPFRSLFPTRENFRFSCALAKLNSVVADIVTQRMKEKKRNRGLMTKTTNNNNNDGENEQEKTTTDDLLSLLLHQNNINNNNNNEREKKQLLPSREQILENVRMFLFAGHETTAATISWALWHLACNPDIQQQLQQEVDALFATSSSSPSSRKEDQQHQNLNNWYPSFVELRQLKLLNAVTKETLRLNAPAGISRRTLADISLQNKKKNGKACYVIPKGAQVQIFPWFVHRHANYWEHPHAFDPSRFLTSSSGWIEKRPIKKGTGGSTNENSNNKENKKFFSHPFLPFSVGPRSCVGQQLAMAEIRAVLAHIVHHFTIEPAPGAVEPTPTWTVTISPNQVMLRFLPRKGRTSI